MACFRYGSYLPGWKHQVMFFTINSALFLCSVIGNSLVIYLVWRKSALRLPTYFLLSFLAISDLLTTLFGQFLFIISIAVIKDIDCTMDKILAFMHVSSCTSSLLLLSLITRDRYLHVSKRECYFNHTSNRFAITASIACYLFGMMVATTFMFDDRHVRLLSPISIAVIGSFSFTFICLRSRKIIRIVQEHNKQMELNCKDDFDQTAFTRSTTCEKSVNKSVFSIITVFFASWTPIIILMTIYTVHIFLNKPIADGYRIAFSWSTVVCYINGALNPIIYSYRCDPIGREIRKIVAKFTRRRTVSQQTLQLHAPRRNDVPQGSVNRNEPNNGSF